ncbi:hypothetical protein ACWEIJ_17340 [Lentzea sp. NPDC004789]
MPEAHTLGVHLRLNGVVPSHELWLDTLTVGAGGMSLTYELFPGADLGASRTWRWQCAVEDDLGTIYEDLASGGIEAGAGTRSARQHVPAEAGLLALVISTPRTADAPFGVEVATAVLPLTAGAGASWAGVDRRRTAEQLDRWQRGERDERVRRRLMRKGLVDVSGALTPAGRSSL